MIKQIKNILSKKGYEFKKRDTNFGNNLSLEDEIISKDICFLFKKN